MPQKRGSLRTAKLATVPHLSLFNSCEEEEEEEEEEDDDDDDDDDE